MDALIFDKLENGNYATPHSGLEMTLDEVVAAIQEYNGSHRTTSLYLRENGVYMTQSPSIPLGASSLDT